MVQKISFIIIFLSIVYYTCIFLPRYITKQIDTKISQNNIDIQNAEQARLNSKKQFDDCMSKAAGAGAVSMRNSCNELGLLSQSCSVTINLDLNQYAKTLGINDVKKLDLPSFQTLLDKLFKMGENCVCELPLNKAVEVKKYQMNLENDCYIKFPQKN